MQHINLIQWKMDPHIGKLNQPIPVHQSVSYFYQTLERNIDVNE